MADMVTDFQQQRNGELPDRGRSVLRDIGNRHAVRFCGRNVHNIISGRKNANVFDIGT